MSTAPSLQAHWRQRDLEVLWHPCTQMREHHNDLLPLVPIARGEGAWLIDFEGRRYLDAVSSWWTNLFGHAEPRIGKAIAQQAQQLEQVILAGFSHAPAIELAEALLRRAPRAEGTPPFAKVFYADNGSAGVEVALKMSFHSHRNRGDERRTRFVALSNSYHGETLGALAVSDIPLYRRVYAPLLITPIFTPSPDAYEALPGESPRDCAERAAQALESLLEREGDTISAMIVEPLVQCAGGMRMHHPHYLQRARELCTRYGVHFIADEIAVGFGRTGTLFACEQAGIAPDLMCVSKGLTGGFLPLAAVLAPQHLYEAFLDDSRERAFLHSHSYTGNPLACCARHARHLRQRTGAGTQPRHRRAPGRAGRTAGRASERRRGAPDRDDPRDRTGRRQRHARAASLDATRRPACLLPCDRTRRAAAAAGRRAVLDAALLHRRGRPGSAGAGDALGARRRR